MAKIEYSNGPVKSFGGFHFVYDLFERHGVENKIDTILGKRNSNTKYSLSDVILSHFCSVISGGTALEDVQKMRSELKDIAGSNVPSSDTVIRVLRQLTFPQMEVVNSNSGINKIVDNAPLNELLCALAAKCHKNSAEPTLDIDAHIVTCDKPDADFAYTKEKGYAPMVAFIERCPVSIQNRSGNTSPAFGHIEFVKGTLSMLDDNDIKIKNFRADAASYNYDLMKELDNRKIRFYIRAAQSPAIAACIASLSESSWNKGNLNRKEIEVAEFEHNGYRFVVERTKTGQYNLFTGSAYTYRAIITNDKRKEMTPDNVIYFYNHRGDIERNFDLLRNDFGWTNLPFDNIAENTT